MAIRLGLQRMELLYGSSPQRWRAIHVAGTNGKGSICAYVSAILRESGVSYGRFTSPFLHRPEDSITVNEISISPGRFRTLYDGARLSGNDQPTHFERMTFAAFRTFDEAKVEYGVVETGLGGRLDSTNVLKNKAVTVISKIGLDHQEYLGNTLEAIAAEKAGIMNGAPCVVDGTNPGEVLNVFSSAARTTGSKLIVTTQDEQPMRALHEAAPRLGLARHEVENMACAILAIKHACPGVTIPPISRLAETRMPGRLQLVSIRHRIPGRTASVLLDGAHNAAGARALSRHVERHLRPRGGDSPPVTWVVALSEPRLNDVHDIVRELAQPQDRVVFTTFSKSQANVGDASNPAVWSYSRPDSVPASQLRDRTRSVHDASIPAPESIHARAALPSALELAVDLAGEGPLVVTGSLYLVSDVLRWLQSSI